MPELREYQWKAAWWLHSRSRGILGDEPRLGKTPVSIVAARLLGASRIVVLTRAVARRQWIEEIRTWYPDLDLRNVIVESYERITQRRDIMAQAKALAPEVLILDECHRLKTASAQRTRAIYGTNFKGGLLDYAENTWGLSGTIMPNHVGELWTHLCGLFPGDLPEGTRTEAGYLARYAVLRDFQVKGRWLTKVAGTNAATLPELRGILKKNMLRRTWKEIAPDLPPLVVSPVLVERQAADVTRLIALEMAHKAEIDAYGRAILAGGDPPRPTRGFSEFLHATGFAKVAAAVELVAGELEDNDYSKIILGTHHIDVLTGLATGLAKYGAVMVDGSTPAGIREDAIRQFQTKVGCRVFCGQIETCSEALDLSAASDVLLVEQSPVPDTNYQFCMRAQNSMNPRPINARVLGLADSIDADVAKNCARKIREKVALLDHPGMETV